MANKSVTWLDEYLGYTSVYTDAPPEFHRFIGLSMVGSAIGDKCFYQSGDHTLYPNIWLIILGNSTFMRKSTSLRFGKNILMRHYPTRVYPNEYSIEKLLEILKEHRIGTFFHFEFISFMNLLNRDYMAGMKNLFTELFDVPETFIRKTKQMEINIERPVISMIAATTNSWFLERVQESDLDGGFLPRFLFVPAISKPKFKLPIKMDMKDKEEVAHNLAELVTTVAVDINGEHDFIMDSESEKLYATWCEGHEQRCIDDPQRYRNFTVRHGDYLLKLAMIHQVLLDNKNFEITSQAMTAAIKDITFLGEKIKYLCEGELAFTKEDRTKLKIKKLISASGIKGISQADLLRKSHLMSDHLRKNLETLKEELYIEEEMIDTGADKKTKIWKSKND